MMDASDNLRISSALHVVIAAVVLLVSYALSKAIWNLYFHPLSRFPGPKSWAVSNVQYARHWASGNYHWHLYELHQKYGPVVRIAPNDLSFASVESIQDIYGHVGRGRKQLLKAPFYSNFRSNSSILLQRDPIKHREVRRLLAHAFSAKALRDQTDVVIHYVDLFVSQVARLGNTEEGINLSEWFNWITFDIISDLAFGKSFGACAEARGSPWITLLCDASFAGAWGDIFDRLSFLKVVGPLVLPRELKVILAKRRELIDRVRQSVRKRLENRDNRRSDFFSHLTSDNAVDVSEAFLQMQAQTLIVAGSETTATALAGIFYYLTANPQTFTHLAQEVRAAFSHPKQINGDSTQGLPYLFGVIEEGLRIFPPVSFPLQRTSFGDVIDGHIVPSGTTVSTAAFTATHASQYWHAPLSFWPERWLPPAHALYDAVFARDTAAASAPFSLGPRGCIGVNLAYTELRVIIARLAWQFDCVRCGRRPAVDDWLRDARLLQLWKKPILPVRFVPRADCDVDSWNG